MADDRITTYLPDNSLRKGYLSLFGDIARELVETRWLTYQLFKRDAFAFYKQSVLGGFWIVLLPLITVGTFVLLRGSGVVAVGELETPYPVYAALGVGVWQLFAQGLVAGANSLVQGGEMISRINFSKKSLVIGSMAKALVSFLVLVVLIVVLFAVYWFQGYQLALRPELLLVPFALLPICLLTLGLSFYLALINGIARDVGTMLSMVVTFLLLLTPVLYEPPALTATADTSARILGAITQYNPLYYLVAGPRDLVLTGALAEPKGFFISAGVSVGLFLFSLLGFHLTETRIAERV